MAIAKNKLQVEGNLTADPEFSVSKGKGTPMLKIRFAYNWSEKDENGDWQDTPVYYQATVFGKDAEDLQSVLTKGNRVLVEGRLKPMRPYLNKAGEPAVNPEILADSVLPVTQVRRAAAAVAAKPAKDDLEDLPF